MKGYINFDGHIMGEAMPPRVLFLKLNNVVCPLKF